MGVFDFLKKKDKVDKPMAPPNLDLPPLTDLPPIDGSALPELDFSSASGQDTRNVSKQPGSQFENMQGSDVSKKGGSLIVNLPSLDFTLPTKDEEGMSHEHDAEMSPLPSFASQDASNDSSGNSGGLFQAQAPSYQDSGYIDLSEDINRLFLADDKWKEPDWNTFDPYIEPEIEPPQPADFGVDESNPSDTYGSGYDGEDSTLPSFNESEHKRIPTDVPVDVFVRGSDYVRVYAELDRINYLLDNQEPKILTLFEDVLHKEEEILKKNKDSMEYVYRKLMIIDRKIFG